MAIRQRTSLDVLSPPSSNFIYIPSKHIALHVSSTQIYVGMCNSHRKEIAKNMNYMNVMWELFHCKLKQQKIVLN